MLRHILREFGFVVLLFVKSDREGAHRLGALLLHHRHDERGIDPAAEERTQGHVGDHAHAHGLLQQRFEFGDGIRIGATERVIEALLDDLRQAPVVAGLGALVRGFEREQSCRRELFETLVDAQRIGDVVVAQQGGERFAIHGGVEAGEWLDGFQFGGEHERFAHPAVVERFFTEAVAAEMQHAVLPVPHGEGKHAVEAFRGLDDAPLAKGREHDLGVRMAAPGVTVFFEFGAKVLEVVDLAVEDDLKALVGAGHWLMAER